MEPPYHGHGDYVSEDQDEHRHSLFHHRPPPPPPPFEEDDFGGRRGFDERRDDDDGGFPRRYGRFEEERFGREDEQEEGYGRRRGDPDRERFGRGDDHEAGEYPPEGCRPHFTHMGFHRPQHESAPTPCAPTPSDDVEYPQYGAASHSLVHSGSHHGQRPSDESVIADPMLAKEELPVQGDALLATQMDSLSLDLPQGKLMRIFCKENSAFNLAVDHNSLEMQESNTEDEMQIWIKDASHGLRIKDSYGYPAFSLVNKKTKKVLKHANEKGQQVLLVDYQADLKDDNILWTESQDFGEGFKTIRAASDTLLNLTVFEGYKKIRNGSALMLDTWHKADHQLWKIFPL